MENLLIEKTYKVSTKKYLDKENIIYPGNIYLKEVYKYENSIIINRKYICSIEDAINNNLLEKLNKDQVDLFKSINKKFYK